MAKKKAPTSQILLFPTRADALARSDSPFAETDRSLSVMEGSGVLPTQSGTDALTAPTEEFEVVLSGTYRKDSQGLRLAYEELGDLGCKVLSPLNVDFSREVDGFVYMRGEESESPDAIESRHLDAIQRARFVWLHAPEGYVGPTAALEIGFARAMGIPVFSKSQIKERILQPFVEVVESPRTCLAWLASNRLSAPPPAIQSFQNYYKRVAVHRGYEKESAKDCLILMMEEVGELARSIRQREKLVRHGHTQQTGAGLELADVFLYVIHMANTLDVDLSSLVQEKENLNLKKFLRR